MLNLFLLKNTFALEISCLFEEVYQNAEIQQGFFLIKNSKLRYEYHDENLFTIIAKKGKFYLISNSNKDSFRILDEDIELIDELMKIISDFPNVNEIYSINKRIYKIERNSKNFIKRIAINSDDLKISINFLNCEFKKIQDKFFRHFPLEEYNY